MTKAEQNHHIRSCAHMASCSLSQVTPLSLKRQHILSPETKALRGQPWPEQRRPGQAQRWGVTSEVMPPLPDLTPADAAQMRCRPMETGIRRQDSPPQIGTLPPRYHRWISRGASWH